MAGRVTALWTHVESTLPRWDSNPHAGALPWREPRTRDCDPAIITRCAISNSASRSSRSVAPSLVRGTVAREIGAESWNRTNASTLRGERHTTRLFLLENWSEKRESNPYLNLGKVPRYRYAISAQKLVESRGLEPRKPARGDWFTASCNCRYTNLPRNLEHRL